MHKLSSSDLQFNYTSWLHRANFLSFSEKKGDRKRFFVKRKKLAQFRRLVEFKDPPPPGFQKNTSWYKVS